MKWNAIEALIHENYRNLNKKELESISAELLTGITDGMNPLAAAKIAYVLTLLQLKSMPVNERKALHFLENLRAIIKHELEVAELSREKNASVHLLYVRKLAEHYLHHLMILAELRDAKDVQAKLKALRKKNHERLLELQPSGGSFYNKERQLIKRTIRKHYLFSGFLFSIALYFSWISFWSLFDFVFARWVYSEFNSEIVYQLTQKSLLFLFALSFIWGFIKYQSDPNYEFDPNDPND